MFPARLLAINPDRATQHHRMKRSSKRSQPKRNGAVPASPLKDTGKAPRPISRGRLWLFRLMALSLPFVFLLLLEIILRIAGQGYPTSFFQEIRAADRQEF